MTTDRPRLTPSELEAERATLLPAKQVISLLNLDVDLDVALDLAAPIDLAVAANAQAALPINASVSAGVLTIDSASAAQATQAAVIDQTLSGSALAEAPQSAVIDQSGSDLADGGETESAPAPSTADAGATIQEASVDDLLGDAAGSLDSLAGVAGQLFEGGLLNIEVDAAVDADLTAPVAGAVAANANVAAPINASVSANVGTIGSQSVAVADQAVSITQVMEDVTATAIADQDAEITQ
jgi:hypothetical protein